MKFLIFLTLLISIKCSYVSSGSSRRTLIPPIVINTWNFTTANARAWQELRKNNTALDAVEFGCQQCEVDRCDGTVGWGGSPSETGETTLDAMIMDGETYDVGAVAGLRRIKHAISIARLVLERTKHTLLVGDMATKFAVELGFKEESLASNESVKIWHDWLNRSCQPNFWKNVSPDPQLSCGPYKPIPMKNSNGGRLSVGSSPYYYLTKEKENFFTTGHDTIGILALDSQLRIASGTSTNGLRHKILGRVGDSPVPGSGSYAAKEAGAATATGDGDIIMRFLVSYQAVENLRQGLNAQEAAEETLRRIKNRVSTPYPRVGVLVLSKDGSFGASCLGIKSFPFVVSDSKKQVQTLETSCI